MKIRYKAALGITREGVEPAILNGDAGWVRQLRDISNFYPSTKWEPVEEWVDIQVRKEEWDTMQINLCYTNNGKENTILGMKWRYSQ